MSWQSTINSLWDIDKQDAPRDICALIPELKSFLSSEANNPMAQYLVGNGYECLPTLEMMRYCGIIERTTSDIKEYKRDKKNKEREQKKKNAKKLKRILKNFEKRTNLKMQELSELLVAQLGSHIKDSKKYLRALRAVIERGNEQSVFSLCPPKHSFNLTYEKSPFTEENFMLLPFVDLWRSTIKESVEKDTALGTREKLGRFFASAILHGGLLNRSLLDSLFRELPKGIEVLGGAAFIDLDIGNPDKDTFKETRRWFLDPLSEISLLRLTKADFEWISQNIQLCSSHQMPVWKCIKSFFSCKLKTPADRPTSLTKIMSAASFDYSLSIPPFLVHYAKGHLHAHSLKKEAFLRIHGCKASMEKDSSEQGLQEDSWRKKEPDLPEYEGAVLYPHWYVDLQNQLKGSDNRKALREIKNLLNGAVGAPDGKNLQIPISEMLLNWAYFLLKEGGRNNGQMPLKFVRAHIKDIGSRFIGVMGGDDITELDSHHLIDIYTQILEDATSSGVRSRFAKELKQFHIFLQKTYHFDIDDFKSLVTIGLTPVDANIISEDEFQRILSSKSLQKLAKRHSSLAQAAKIMLILGFRCGTRRSEASGLLMDDLHSIVPAELFIMPNEYRGVKTPNSERVIPIEALIPPSELELIREFERARHKEEKNSPFSQYFFAIKDLGYKIIPPQAVFTAIKKALEEATGDKSIRFHHLRHSFATWALTKLILAPNDLTQLPIGSNLRSIPNLEQTWNSLYEADDFKKKVFNNDEPTRKALFAISSILGHSGPAMSLEHYIHSCDILLAGYLRKTIPLERKTLLLASGMKETTVHNWFEAGGNHQKFFDHFRKHAVTNGAKITFHHPQKIKSPSSAKLERDTSSPKFKKIYDILHSLAMEEASLEQLSKRHEINFETAQLFSAAAKQLCTMSVVNRGKVVFIHDMELHPKTEERIACPQWPEDEDGTVFFKRISTKLWGTLSPNSPHHKIATDAIHYFISRTWKSSKYIYFSNIHDDGKAAGNYLKFLKIIGIKNDEIHFVNFDPRIRSPYRAEWNKLLKLRKGKKIHLPKEGEYSGKNKERLGIAILLPNEEGPRRYSKIQFSKSFPFLMKMAYILLSKA